MVQATEARHRSHLCASCRLRLDWPLVRGVFLERVMNSVLLIVAHIITHEPEQMPFVHSDDMVQDLPATTSHPPFCGSILPRRLNTSPFRLQTRRLQKRDHVSIEFRIAVEDHVAVWASFRKGLAQLLDDPIRCRISMAVSVRLRKKTPTAASRETMHSSTNSLF